MSLKTDTKNSEASVVTNSDWKSPKIYRTIPEGILEMSNGCGIVSPRVSGGTIYLLKVREQNEMNGLMVKLIMSVQVNLKN